MDLRGTLLMIRNCSTWIQFPFSSWWKTMQGFSSLLRAVLQVSVIKSKVNKISLYLNQE